MRFLRAVVCQRNKRLFDFGMWEKDYNFAVLWIEPLFELSRPVSRFEPCTCIREASGESLARRETP